MADVLFTHSYFLRHDPKEERAMIPYPPLGTLYAAAYIRQRGYTAALFDSMLALGELEIRDSIAKHRPAVVAIYDDDFNYLTKMCLSRMREAAFTMAELAKAYGCTVVVHGSDPADHTDAYLAHGADFVLCGEGEQTLGDLLDALRIPGSPLGSIPGLAYIAGGRVHRTPARQPMRNLDALPFPSRDLLDIERYRLLWLKRHGYFSLNMVTTRGCPYHCNWCAKPVYGQVYNGRSPANVVAEMQLIKEQFRPDHIWFCDDIFGLKPGWIEEFSHAVMAADAVIPYKCLGRADLLLKNGTISHLQRSGCTSVWIGAESGSQKILDAMEKGITVQQILEASRQLKKAGIQVGFFLQYGYPGESREDIDQTLRMVKEAGPDDIGISVSYPLPGTRFYERVQEQMGKKKNWEDSEDLALMYRGTYAPDFYRALHRITHKNFRLWQGLDIMRDTFVHPWRLNARRLRRMAAVPYHAATLPGQRRRMEVLARQSGDSSLPLAGGNDD